MATTTIATRDESKEIIVAELTREQVLVVKKTICDGYTDIELQLFLHQCQELKLNPLAREVYTFKAGGKIVIGVGIDGFRKRANDTGCYLPGRPTEYDYDDKGKLMAARVFVKRLVGGEWHEVCEDAYYDEFKGKGNWQTMPRVMLSKCAEARALRRTFPRELGGLYVPEERAAIEQSRMTRAQQNMQSFSIPATGDVIDRPVEPGWYERLFALAKTSGHSEWENMLTAAIVDTGKDDLNPELYGEADVDSVMVRFEELAGM